MVDLTPDDFPLDTAMEHWRTVVRSDNPPHFHPEHELTDAVARADFGHNQPGEDWVEDLDRDDRSEWRANAVAVLAAIQSYLRDRGLLLGPDGLVRAERQNPPRNIFGAAVYLVNTDQTLFTLIPEEGS